MTRQELENLRMSTREKRQTPIFYLVIFLVSILAFYSSPSNAADALTMIRIIECESGGRYNAVGDDGVSVGIAQFQQITFNEMKRKAHMFKLKWTNPIDQLKLMNWMLDHGYGNRWTCYRRIIRHVHHSR